MWEGKQAYWDSVRNHLESILEAENQPTGKRFSYVNVRYPTTEFNACSGMFDGDKYTAINEKLIEQSTANGAKITPLSEADLLELLKADS